MTALELDSFLQALEQADALEKIQHLIIGLRDAFEIDHVVYIGSAQMASNTDLEPTTRRGRSGMWNATTSALIL